MIALLVAFQFLTICPPIVRRPLSPRELGRSVGWYPLVGLALGGVLLALDRGLGLIEQSSVTAALVLAAWVILTRALHLDGWMDTCDGLFGGFTAERRLEIMRDSRAGAFGVAGGVLILLIKYAALAALPDRMVGLLLAPTLGRWAMAVALIGCPYGRAEGLGRDVKDHAGWTQATLATATALIAAWLIAGWGGVIGLALAGVGTLVGAWFILRLIPGLTGDTYGAICEGIEALSLLFFATETALWAS